MIRCLGAVTLLLAAGVATATALPAPGTVEVRDEVGTLVDAKTGPDAIRDALGVVAARRGADGAPWTVVIAAGQYGDAAIGVRNVTVMADPPGSVTISGTGGSDDTGGGCVDITRGPVTLDGITCTGAARTGINVTPPNAEGGIVLRGVAVHGAGVDGIAVTGGTGIVIQGAVISNARRDGIRLNGLTAAGPYAIVGGSVTGAAQHGLHLADDVTKLQVSNFTASGCKGYGIVSGDSGNADVTFTGVTASLNGKDGVAIHGGGLRIAVRDSVATGNGGSGIRLGEGTGLALSGIGLDGTNGGGDLLFTAAVRTGGAYTGLGVGGQFSLVGEPRAVRISAARAGTVAARVGGRARAGVGLVIGATASVKSRRAVVRWDGGASVWRGAGKWTKVGSARRIRGGMQAVLGTSLLGTTGAVYASFG